MNWGRKPHRSIQHDVSKECFHAACALLVTGGLFSAVLFSTAISDRIPSSIPFSNEESAQAAAALLQEHTTLAALLGLDVPDNGAIPVSTTPLPGKNEKTFGEYCLDAWCRLWENNP